MNLLSNALKFTQKGYISMIFDLEEVDEAKAKEVKNVKLVKRKLLIEIEDTGIGIKNEDLSKLFKYFGKLKDT